MSITIILSTVTIATLVISKYLNKPQYFLLVIILAAIIYQRQRGKVSALNNFEEKLIGFSKFVIVTGILGYLVVKILGIFVPQLN